MYLTTCFAQYQSEVGQKRRLTGEKTRYGWSARFSGFGLGRNSRGFRAYSPEGLALLAWLYVSGWSGHWRITSSNFPPVPTALGVRS